MRRTYCVELWDHDPAGDGSQKGRWSAELARVVLGGPNEGLSWREIGRAVRALRAMGWSDVSMIVSREGEA